MEEKSSATYRAYLLRLWRNTPQETWRVTLRHISDEQEHHFSDLESLFSYLSQQEEYTLGNKRS